MAEKPLDVGSWQVTRGKPGAVQRKRLKPGFAGEKQRTGIPGTLRKIFEERLEKHGVDPQSVDISALVDPSLSSAGGLESEMARTLRQQIELMYGIPQTMFYSKVEEGIDYLKGQDEAIEGILKSPCGFIDVLRLAYPEISKQKDDFWHQKGHKEKRVDWLKDRLINERHSILDYTGGIYRDECPDGKNIDIANQFLDEYRNLLQKRNLNRFFQGPRVTIQSNKGWVTHINGKPLFPKMKAVRLEELGLTSVYKPIIATRSEEGGTLAVYARLDEPEELANIPHEHKIRTTIAPSAVTPMKPEMEQKIKMAQGDVPLSVRHPELYIDYGPSELEGKLLLTPSRQIALKPEYTKQDIKKKDSFIDRKPLLERYPELKGEDPKKYLVTQKGVMRFKL